MRGVTVTGVEKVDKQNAERVRCRKYGAGAAWGDIEELTFIAPQGTHHVGQSITLPEIEGSTGYT